MSTQEFVPKNLHSRSENQLQRALPAVLARAEKAACFAVDKFFSARLSNAHTRTAYAHQVGRFLAWCEEEGPQLRQVTPGLAGHAHPRTTQIYDRRRASRNLVERISV